MVGSRQALGVLRHFCLLGAFVAVLDAQPQVSSLAEKPPADLAPAVASLLQSTGVKTFVSGATLDLWLVQNIATNGDGPGWSSVESGTLVGAMRVTGAFKEIRGKVVAPGLYTLRYGLQPQNGDHLGISTYRDFLVISPASVDKDPKVLGFDGAVALSKQVIGTSHPAALSLDPPEDAPGAVLSTYKNDSGHDGVVFEVPRQPAGTIKFGLIVSGLIVH
jgi:hypothetical protein